MRPKFELADILRDYLDDYKAHHSLSLVQHKAVQAILNCRTAALGGHVDCCSSCGHIRSISYNSCRNRHCPKCQWAAQQRWIRNRLEELLPVKYFHLVFTLPQELNGLVSSNESKMYGLLFHIAWQTIYQLCGQSQWLGAQPGMIAVLHTWGQNLSFHPHLHCIVPGGGLAPDGQSWINRPNSYLLPTKVMSRLFRGKFLYALKLLYTAGELSFFGKAQALQDAIAFRNQLRPLYKKEWVVYAKQPFGGPEQVINYLGRYTHRIAISNQRITNISASKVTFSYKDYRQDGQKKSMTLDAHEFIRRFLQHCLPTGFQKIRYYGILSTRNRKTKLANLQAALGYEPPVQEPEPIITHKQPATSCCPVCGKNTMKTFVIPNSIVPINRMAKVYVCKEQRAPPSLKKTLFEAV